MKKQITPTLFVVLFVLVLFARNMDQVSVNIITTSLIGYTIASVIVTAIFFFLIKNRDKACICCTFFTVLFLSFSGVMSLLPPDNSNLALVISPSLFIIACIIIRRSKRNLAKFSDFLLIIAVMSLLMTVGRITFFEYNRHLQTNNPSNLVLPVVDVTKITNYPDIYYLIPDSYTSTGVMNQKYGYDNSRYMNFLTDKGFYIATQSSSNYPKTFLSITSSLNMEYLDYLSKSKNSSDQTLVNRLIEDSNVRRFLKSLGYKYYQMGSWWIPTQYNPYADDNFILESEWGLRIDNFTYATLQSTILRPVLNRILRERFLTKSDGDKRRRVIYQFNKLPEIVNLPGPKFVFMHILSPHEPYVFGANCEYIGLNEANKHSVEENYVNQIKCINWKLENAVDQIIGQSSHPPVILIQADEGPPFLSRKMNPIDSWGSASLEVLKEKFPIMAAYYLPGIVDSKLYSTISPVNSFRVIFNSYFSTKFPLLPDKNYIYLDTNHVYDFKEVTEEIK